MSTLLEQASLVMIPSGYKEDVVYSQIPTDGAGDLSFTRASNGTRINSAGLVEVCPWNEFENSNLFTSWTSSGASVTITSGQTDPIGGTNAFLYARTLAFDYLLDTVPSNKYTVYCTVKKATSNFFRIAASTVSEDAIFNINTGVINSTTSDVTATIESLGNGWYKCIAVFNVATTGFFLQNFPVANGSAGNGSVYIYQAQANIGATAKPYFPTTDRLNVPRLTYQNGGGGCPSLLLEKQSTNLAIQSNTFNTSPWAMFAGPAVTPNSTISPDGTQNATTLNSSGGSNDFLYQTITGLTTGATYAFSFYVKNINSTASQLWGAATGTAIMYINWSGETLTSVSGTGSSFVAVGNGWYRITSTTATAGTGSTVRIYADGNNTSKSIYIYGAQFEAGSYPTSYIPTTSSSATRVDDFIGDQTTTIAQAFTDNTKGTIFFDIAGIETPSTGSEARFRFGNSTTALQIALIVESAGVRAYAYNGGFSLTAVNKLNRKIAIRFNGTEIVAFVNGVKQTTYTASVSFNIEQMFSNTSAPLSFKINQFILFNAPLTDAECIALTS